MKTFFYFVVIIIFLPLYTYSGEKKTYIFLKTKPEASTLYTRPILTFDLDKTARTLGFEDVHLIEIETTSNDLDSIHRQTLELTEKYQPQKIFLMLGLGSRIVAETFSGLPWYESFCPIRHINYFREKNYKAFLNVYTTQIGNIAQDLKQKNVELNLVYIGLGISMKILNLHTGFCGSLFDLVPIEKGVGISSDILIEYLSKKTPVINSPIFSSLFLSYNQNQQVEPEQLQQKLFEILLPAL